MREILFRGKRKDNSEWIHGSLIIFWDKTFISPQSSNTFHKFEVNPKTIGQYIGLNDIDGVKIFEGDILESPVKRLSQKLGNLVVINDIRECKHMALYVSEYRVIGNIYDNPELLKKEGV